VKSYFKVLSVLLLLLISWSGPSWAKECSPLRKGLEQLSLIQNNLSTRFTNEVSPSGVSRLTVLTSKLRPSQLSYSKLPKLLGRKSLALEDILKSAEIRSVTPFNDHGPTNKIFKVVLEDGRTAIWKPHTEVWSSNYRTEVLAYEIDRLFGFNRVPPTVERTIDGQKGSLQLFVKSTNQGSAKSGEFEKLNLFDWIIDHRDRHGGDFNKVTKKWDQGPNYLYAPGGEVIAIDNGLSFMDVGQAYPFEVRKKMIDKFLVSEEGKKVMNRINSTDLNNFETEISEYLGTKDAKDVIQRLNFLTDYYSKLPK
jgi:hypothetical protein